jgi:adenine-specific DNA-methyltransferase
MTFRYIGSKARLTAALSPFIEAVDLGAGRFVDAFCGTGAMAEVAADMGWPVWVNDALESAIVMTCARLTAVEDASFKALGGYDAVLAKLNALKPSRGFMWSEYSPASIRNVGFERRYFSEENAGRIDAMRSRIGEWEADGATTVAETRLLLGDLISAANRIANIAGTYGCFLSKWQKSALDGIELRKRPLRADHVEVTATVADVYDLQVAYEDVVYLDPPYTKRQYASYYHILETIVIGDEPIVEGVSGLRPWRHKASPFCYKTRALGALTDLITGLGSATVLLSYSAEGHVDLDDLRSRLTPAGNVDCVPIEILARYRPNRVASSNGGDVAEYVLTFQRTTIGLEREMERKHDWILPEIMEPTA